jgi:hypothetical protein
MIWIFFLLLTSVYACSQSGDTLTIDEAGTIDFNPTTCTDYNAATLKHVVVTQATEISQNSFLSGSDIESFSSNSLITISGNMVLAKTAKLTSLDLPELETVSGDFVIYMDHTITVGVASPGWTTYQVADLSSSTCVTDGTDLNDCWSLTTLSLPKLTTVGHYFCSQMTNGVNIAGSYKYITSPLTVINLPALTTVGNNVFYKAMSLTSLYLPVLDTTGYSFLGYVGTVDIIKALNAGVPNCPTCQSCDLNDFSCGELKTEFNQVERNCECI